MRSLIPFATLAVASLAALAVACGDASVGTSWHRGPNGEPLPGPATSPTGGSTGNSPSGTPSNNGTGNNNNNGNGNPSPSPTGTGNPAPAPQTASFAVTLDKATATVDLFAQVAYTVSIAPNGYKGTIALTTKDIPSDIDAKFDNASLTLDGSTAASAKLTLTTKTSTAPASTMFTVLASAPEGVQNAASMLTVNSQIVIHVPSGANQLGGSTSNPVKNAFGTYPIQITAPANISSSNPVVIKFFNDDNVNHEIHASSPGAGFPHGNGPFGPQQYESNTTRHVNMKGTYDFYLHDQNAAITVGRIVIQ